jgi:hypothetical protein
LRHKFGRFPFLALLCDRRADASRFLVHHFGRTGRRQLQRMLPGLSSGVASCP